MYKEERERIAEAMSRGEILEITGGGSKRRLGRVVEDKTEEISSGEGGIIFYEPRELCISVKAGTALAEAEEVLSQENQRFAFEPPDYRALLGSQGRRQTIGGIVGCNLSGPRRVQAGAVRDYILGIKSINGRGEVVSFGGRVMKNVTGYDLSKVLTGSYGTLALFKEITLKTLPRSETEATLVVSGLDWIEGQRALSHGFASPYEVSGAAYAPPEVASRLRGEWTRSVALLRIEGFKGLLDKRSEALASHLKEKGETMILEEGESREVWRAIRDVGPFVGTEGCVWKVSTAPSKGPVIVSRIRQEREVEAFLDWGGGLIWMCLPDDGTDGGSG